MAENVDWNQLMTELWRIAEDDTETGTRRRLARNAFRDATRGSGAAAAHAMTKAPAGHATVGNHRGGYSLASDANYGGYE